MRGNEARGLVREGCRLRATDVTIAWTAVMTSGAAVFWSFVAAQCIVASCAAVSLWRAEPLRVP